MVEWQNPLIILPQVSQVFLPYLKYTAKEETDSEMLVEKMKNELLPCLRSLTRWAGEGEGVKVMTLIFSSSALRVAEQVWLEGVLIKDFTPEAFTIKSIDDAWALLKVQV